MKRVIFTLMIFTLILSACGSSSTTGPGTISISITPSPLNISSTDDKKLSDVIVITAVNSDGSSAQILPEQCYFSVTDTSKLTINNYRIKGVSKGTTIVQCTYSGNTKSLVVNVL